MRPRKRFGQNFLCDQTIIDNIITAIAPQQHEGIVEIGPGLGALTKQLLRYIASIDVVELDRDLLPELQKLCSGSDLGQLNIHQADALQFDFCELANPAQKLRIVGNLPYNISTPLIFHLLSQLGCVQDMHFMLQREVANRLAAQPGNKAYGRLSVMAQYHCAIELLFYVPPEAFNPAPKVMSAFVRMMPHKTIAIAARDMNNFSQIVNRAFQTRRKTIHNCLKEWLTASQLTALNIDPQARPEQLTVTEFVAISNFVALGGNI